MGEAAEIVRRATDRLNEDDIDGFVALCSKRIRFQDVPEIPGSRLYQGPDEVRGWAEELREVAKVRFTYWEKEERGDAVMFETSAEGTGASSGAALGWRFWTVWRVKNGLITYHHGYSDRDAALADLEGG